MTTEEIKKINELLDDVNGSIDEMRSKKIEVKDSELPSNLSLMIPGLSSSRAIDFLFSGNVDVLLDKLFNMVASGDIEKILQNEEKMKEVFQAFGFGEGSFEGPVSKSVIRSIQASTESAKFNKMKSNLRKAQLVIKNLERQARFLKDKEQRKKYEEAIYAIKKVLKIAAKIYKNRNLINKKVKRGLSNIVNEDIDPNERIEAIM